MARQPAKYYRQFKNKPYPESRYCLGVPDPKIRIYDVGMKRKGVDQFPFCVHLVNWEKENVSREALKAAHISCNEYVTKFAGKDAFHLRVRVHPFSVLCINTMLSCAGDDNSRLHWSGRIVCLLLGYQWHNAQEALLRAKFMFPGSEKIAVSLKWGFTKFSRTDYVKWKAENIIFLDGVNAK
ncbi:hypothetical protein MKX01_000362, partial [Papaver californicum]